jgi:hypothetical protein
LYTNSCLTTAASTGKYSDGTYCYNVTSGGYVSAVYQCAPYYANACGDGNADGSGSVSVTVRLMESTSFSSNAVNTDTALTIYVEATDINANTYGANFTISSGFDCGTGSITGFGVGITIDTYTVVSVSPTSSSTQSYSTGAGYRNSCWLC